MHRAEPVANKIVSEKWRDRAYNKHRDKLTKIKPSIDNKAPQSFPHLQKNWKRIQTENGMILFLYS
jgi:uncharacterized protein (UPF0261 family)